jgi:hypothetical protein
LEGKRAKNLTFAIFLSFFMEKGASGSGFAEQMSSGSTEEVRNFLYYGVQANGELWQRIK